MKVSTQIKKISFYLSGALIIILGWNIYASTKENELIFPSISSIFNSFGKLIISLDTYELLLLTITRIIISLLTSFLVSLIIAFCYSACSYSLFFFKPLLTIFKSTPLIIISLFIWMAFSGDFGPIFVNILVIIPIITEGLINGINSINQDILDQFKLENANNFKKFIYLDLPINKNTIVMVILQTFGLSFKVMIMAEYLCQTNNSIGKTLNIIKSNLEMNGLLAWGIIIVILVTIFEQIINKVNKSLDF